MNWAEQILSLSQTTEVALGFLELLRIVLKDDILYNESLQGHYVDIKKTILNVKIQKKIQIFQIMEMSSKRR